MSRLLAIRPQSVTWIVSLETLPFLLLYDDGAFVELIYEFFDLMLPIRYMCIRMDKDMCGIYSLLGPMELWYMSEHTDIILKGLLPTAEFNYGLFQRVIVSIPSVNLKSHGEQRVQWPWAINHMYCTSYLVVHGQALYATNTRPDNNKNHSDRPKSHSTNCRKLARNSSQFIPYF